MDAAHSTILIFTVFTSWRFSSHSASTLNDWKGYVKRAPVIFYLPYGLPCVGTLATSALAVSKAFQLSVCSEIFMSASPTLKRGSSVSSSLSDVRVVRPELAGTVAVGL